MPQVQMPKSEIEMVEVLRVKALGEYRLWLRFTDGSEGTRDFSEMIARGGPMVEPLKDTVYFARVFVELGALIWPNGFALDPIALHDRMLAAGELRSVAGVGRILHVTCALRFVPHLLKW
jgi:hypothetical protein